ncbi:MAG: glycosyltransferase [Pirellulaceae bacterium]|nr:glycosyltransferase [Pirellulaceae bacterium]
MTDHAGAFVSIVIPAFNMEDCVGRAIKSALAQSYANTEVIVIDDGSKDRTADVARGFGQLVKVVTVQNGGACAARNVGLRLSSGRYVQFLDADDELLPKKIETSLAALIEPENIVCTRWRNVCEHGGGKPILSRPFLGTDALTQVLEGQVQTSSALYPVGVLKSVGAWRTDLTCGQDFDLNLRLVVAGRAFQFLNEEHFVLYRRAESISSDERQVWPNLFASALNAVAELVRLKRLRREHRNSLSMFFAKLSKRLAKVEMDELAMDAFRLSRSIAGNYGVSVAYSSVARRLVSVLGPVEFERLSRRLRKYMVHRTY